MRPLAFFLPKLVQGALDLLKRLVEVLVAFGPLGAFVIAILDSFLPLFGGPDYAVVGISLAYRDSYGVVAATVAAATVGAVIGATFVYLAARKAGAAALERFSPSRRARVENLLGQNDILTVAMACIMPPPFPFKLFNLAAGVFRVAVPRFMIAMLIGRGVRFGVIAFLTVRYGDTALDLLREHAIGILVAIVLIALVAVGWRVLAGRRRGAHPASPDS
jgi:membrane protein YqaA with SNARE-associated domain